MGRAKHTPVQTELERDAELLAGDAHVIRAIKTQFSDVTFVNHLSVSKKQATSDFAHTGGPTKYDGVTHLSRPFKVSPLKFFRQVTLPNIKHLFFQEKSNRQCVRDIKEEISSERHQSDPKYYHDIKTIREQNPTLTPREDLASIAGIHPHEMNPDVEITSAENAAFTLRHEAGHHRFWELLDDPARKMTGSSPPVITQGNAGYKKLWEKTTQAHSVEDDYVDYLSESMADAFGMLGHLRDGGNTDFIRAYADSRANSFYKHPGSPKHGTHHVLDFIAENAEDLKKHMAGMSDKEIDSLTAEMVGEAAMDREPYYQQAFIVQTNEFAQEQNTDPADVDFTKELENKHSHVRKMWIDYHGSERRPWGEVNDDLSALVEKSMDQQRDYISARVGEAEEGLSSGQPPSKEQKMAEVYGVIKHLQETNPEFGGAKGARELLHRRNMAVHSLYRGQDVYEELGIQNALEKYIDQQIAHETEQHLTNDFYAMAPGR